MTHDRQESEPNLVPLLDLVLQLVMFFMMCANFVMEQTDTSIKLPVAQSAKPTEETGRDVVYLNIDAEGQLRTVGRSLSEEETPAFLQGVRDDAAKRTPDAEPDTLVIIRADREASYAAVYKVMRQCREAGLRKMQLRATVGG